MLKTTLLPTSLVFDLEFEGHAVGIIYETWRKKTRIMGLPNGTEIVIVGKTMWAQSYNNSHQMQITAFFVFISVLVFLTSSLCMARQYYTSTYLHPFCFWVRLHVFIYSVPSIMREPNKHAYFILYLQAYHLVVGGFKGGTGAGHVPPKPWPAELVGVVESRPDQNLDRSRFLLHSYTN